MVDKVLLFILLLVAVLASAILWEVKKIMREKAEQERQKKEILKNFLSLKKRVSGVPPVLTCYKCGTKASPDYFSITVGYSDSGEIEHVYLTCPVCKREIEYDREFPAGRFAGRLERYLKEVVLPAGRTKEGAWEALKVAEKLMGK